MRRYVMHTAEYKPDAIKVAMRGDRTMVRSRRIWVSTAEFHVRIRTWILGSSGHLQGRSETTARILSARATALAIF